MAMGNNDEWCAVNWWTWNPGQRLASQPHGVRRKVIADDVIAGNQRRG
jgi:hypothetical protein